MCTGSVIVGRDESGVIVCGPDPGISNWIRSCAETFALASSIACRSDPAPLSFVFVTTNVRFGLTIVVCATAVLFAAMGSSDVLVTVAVFVITPRHGRNHDDEDRRAATVGHLAKSCR